MIYLDHSATTPLDRAVLAAMEPTWREAFGNPASAHAVGASAAQLAVRARRQVGACLGARASEIVFTSGGTEGDNLAVSGAWRAAGATGRILYSGVEHPAVREPAVALAGSDAVAIPVDGDGRVLLPQLERLLADPRPVALVSVMHASNEVGTVQPVAEIGALCRGRGATFHVDAVQSVAQLDFDVAAIGCDLVTITAHKIYGPKGSGALYVREGTPLEAQLLGGGQEGGLRPGTLNVSGVVGLGAACELAVERRSHSPALAALRDRLLAGLRERFPDLVLLGSATERLPGHLSVSVPSISARDMVLHLDAMGVAISRGSACHSGTDVPSAVLAAMGHDSRIAQGALRLTLGHATTLEEIEETLSMVGEAAEICAAP